MKKDTWHYENKYLLVYFTRGFGITYAICGYFDNRPRIQLTLFFIHISIILPFRNEWTDECDPPTWGIRIHDNTVWIMRGGKGNMNGGNKWWTWDIPFFDKIWVRTSILLNDGTWEHETPGNSKDFWKEEWKEKQRSWEDNFIDGYDGKIILTRIYVEEREWRPKWLTWTSLFGKVNRTLDIHFSEEVGAGKGGWKGGTLQCGYTLEEGEEPLDCLRRMEAERTFT